MGITQVYMAGGFQISCTHFLQILTLIQDPTILVGLRNVRFVNFLPCSVLLVTVGALFQVL